MLQVLIGHSGEKRKRRFGSGLNLQCTDDDNYHDDNLQLQCPDDDVVGSICNALMMVLVVT